MQTEWETQRRELRKTADNLIVSLSILIFQHTYSVKLRLSAKILPMVHWLLLGNCEAIFQLGEEKIPPLLPSSLQRYPTENSQHLGPLFVAALSNRANELRGGEVREIGWNRGGGNPLCILFQV